MISLRHCSINVDGQLSFLPHDSVRQGPWLSLLYRWGDCGSESLRDLPSLLEGRLRVTLGFSESIPWACCMKQSPSYLWLWFSGMVTEGGICGSQRRNLIVCSAQDTVPFTITELSSLELSGALQEVYDFWVSIRGVDCAQRQDLKEDSLLLRSWEAHISSSYEIIQIRSMQVYTKIRKQKIWSRLFFFF